MGRNFNVMSVCVCVLTAPKLCQAGLNPRRGGKPTGVSALFLLTESIRNSEELLVNILLTRYWARTQSRETGIDASVKE